MSLIMALGTENFIILSGDRRGMKEDGSVGTEEYQKIYIINDKVLLGFTGDVESCIDIVGYLKDTNCNEYTLDTLSNELQERAKKTFKSKKKGFNIILGGLNENKEFEIHTFTTSNDLILEKQYIKRKTEIKFVSLCSDSADGKPFKILESIFNGMIPTKEKARELLLDIHKQIAEIDDTVNTNIDFLCLDKKLGIDYRRFK